MLSRLIDESMRIERDEILIASVELQQGREGEEDDDVMRR